MNPTDAELIAAYRDSSRACALDELVRRHIATVRGIVFPMVLDDAAADDITQDVFLRAVRGLENFRGQAEFTTWLYRIAVNCGRTHLQTVAKEPPRGELATEELVASPDCQPEQLAIGRETDQELCAALARLTPKLRSAVVLVLLNGMSASEAARVEGCRTATMHWRIHEARRRLKSMLRGHLPRVSIPGAVPIDVSTSRLQRSGIPAEIYRQHVGGVEYRLYQTPVQLDDRLG